MVRAGWIGLAALGLLALWRGGRLWWLEEAARRLSDTLLNIVLSATSGFEREGRDPARP